MWTITPPLKIIRYLVVLRVNNAVVRLPPCPTADLSRTLGEIIASRLPTQDARLWNKTLKAWQGYAGKEDEETLTTSASVRAKTQQGEEFPDVNWPIDALLQVYPGKQIYGQGEQILWEIKLLGESADHNLFLELLLPAIEAASMTREPRWVQSNNLWGRFEIESIFVAKGLQWQPFVEQGQMDLSLRPTHAQWAIDLPFKSAENRPLTKLLWQTPFAFSDSPAEKAQNANNRRQRENRAVSPPSLLRVLHGCASRIDAYLPGWLESKQRPDWQEVLEIAARVTAVNAQLDVPSHHCPGQGIGKQTFSKIPPVTVPYLVLGSLLHIGQYTHLGCGTFLLGK